MAVASFKEILCCCVGGYGMIKMATCLFPSAFIPIVPSHIKAKLIQTYPVNIYENNKYDFYDYASNSIYITDPTNMFVINHEIAHANDRGMIRTTGALNSALFVAASATRRVHLFVPLYLLEHFTSYYFELRADKYAISMINKADLLRQANLFIIYHLDTKCVLGSDIGVVQKAKYLLEYMLDVHPSDLSRARMLMSAVDKIE
jgi:hypothetical protein